MNGRIATAGSRSAASSGSWTVLGDLAVQQRAVGELMEERRDRAQERHDSEQLEHK